MKTKLILAQFFIAALIRAQIWSPLGVGNEFTSNVWTIAEDQQNATIYFGGCFDTLRGLGVHHAGKWFQNDYDSVGSGINVGSNYGIMASAVYNNEWYVGGKFNLAGGVPANNVARWNGSQWLSLSGGVNNTVRAMAVFNGQLFIGGDFTKVNGQTIYYLAKWNGTQWIYPAIAINGAVNDLEVLGSDLYICTNTCIIRYDGTFTYQLANQGGKSIAVYNNEVYVGGTFPAFDGIPGTRGIVKYNGLAWQSVGGGITAINSPFFYGIYDMEEYNGKLFVGGSFTKMGATIASNIANWNGNSWSAMGSGTNNPVLTLAEINSELLVGGDFTLAGGQAINFLARWVEPMGIDDPTVLQSNIFPNPSFGIFTIEAENGELEIYNSLGELVYAKKIEQPQTKLDLSNKAKGLYHLILRNENEVFTQKIVIR
ncbi:MAG: T9SS type A sorting domain-containing protein [Bacteroidota bacterium]